MPKKKVKKSRKKASKDKSLLFIIIFLAAAVVSFFSYYFYKTNIYDSTMDGSEIVHEIRHNKIPEDVKLSLKQKNSTGNVLPASIYRIPILMYHYVEYVEDPKDKTRTSLTLSPFTLEKQIETLSEAGYTFITNKELADIIDGKAKSPSLPILLTFDDGYDDFYTYVLPILRKHNAKATNYVITGFLNRKNHLSDSQIREILASGLVEIGAHTVNHSWLKGKSLNSNMDEVAESKQELEKRFNIKVVSFAYPFGAFDSSSIDAVRFSGLRSAVSTVPGVEQSKENEFFLLRLRPGGRTGETLINFLKQNKFSEY